MLCPGGKEYKSSASLSTVQLVEGCHKFCKHQRWHCIQI